MDETEAYHAEKMAERWRAEGIDRVDDLVGGEYSLEEIFGEDPLANPAVWDPWTRNETVR